MGTSRLHIVFGSTAADTLREAFVGSDRSERVIWFPDDLSFGPIDPPEPEARRQWLRRELGVDPEEWLPTRSAVDAFWHDVLSAPQTPLVWFCRRSTVEYSGFLECVRRFGDRAYEVVDLTAIEVVRGDGEGGTMARPVLGLGETKPGEAKEFLGRAAPLSVEATERCQAQWARLRTENAPLRVLERGDLVSAPLSFFDDAIMSGATHNWRKVARMIAEVWMKYWDEFIFQVGEIVIAARIRALVAAGRLESQGDLSRIRYSEVRLPVEETAALPVPASPSQS